MTYDEVRQQVVLFGGVNADVGGIDLGDTWTWDGAAWTQHTTGVAPPPRSRAALVCHTAAGHCVLFGGNHLGALGDTWLWNGVNWTGVSSAQRPSARYEPAAAYDPVRQRVVLHQGRPNSATVALDTWEWNGLAWLPTASPTQPSGPVVWNGQLGRVAVVTGYGAIHTWDGTQWQAVGVHAPIGERPHPAALAWHGGRGRVVSYSSGVSNHTLWNLSPDAPLAETYGDPCPGGTTQDCDLLALGLPWLGNQRLVFDLRGAASNTYGAVLFGLSSGNTAIGGGCRLLVDMPILGQLAWMGPGGTTPLRATMPNSTAYTGLQLFAQGFVLDGLGPANGVGVSRGLRLRLGH